VWTVSRMAIGFKDLNVSEICLDVLFVAGVVISLAIVGRAIYAAMLDRDWGGE